MSTYFSHIILNIALFVGAMLLAAMYVIVSIRDLLKHTELRGDLPMRAYWIAMKALTCITAALLALADVFIVLGFKVDVVVQYWLQTLIAANIFGAMAVSFSRLVYDRSRRKYVSAQKQQLIEVIQQASTNDTTENIKTMAYHAK